MERRAFDGAAAVEIELARGDVERSADRQRTARIDIDGRVRAVDEEGICGGCAVDRDRVIAAGGVDRGAVGRCRSAIRRVWVPVARSFPISRTDIPEVAGHPVLQGISQELIGFGTMIVPSCFESMTVAVTPHESVGAQIALIAALPPQSAQSAASMTVTEEWRALERI